MKPYTLIERKELALEEKMEIEVTKKIQLSGPNLLIQQSNARMLV